MIERIVRRMEALSRQLQNLMFECNLQVTRRRNLLARKELEKSLKPEYSFPENLHMKLQLPISSFVFYTLTALRAPV